MCCSWWCGGGGVGCCCPYDGFGDEDEGRRHNPRGGVSSWTNSPVRSMEERLLAIEVNRKIVMLGYRGVGKSALVSRFVQGQFLDTYEPTIEYTFRKVQSRNNVRFVCDILDTSAQDEYSSLSRQASVGVHGYILVYSCTSRTSFENIKVIHDKIINVIGGPTIPMIIVATKFDLKEFSEVSSSEGKQLAASLGYSFVECSAKTYWNVDLVFSTILGTIEQESGLLKEAQSDRCTIL